MRLLLENGANPNAVCEFGWNARKRALDFLQMINTKECDF